MKTTLTYLSILSFSFFLFSCGGGDSTKQTEADGAEQMEDSKAAESEEMNLSGTYVLDVNESVLMWEGNMLKVGGVSLYGHNGTINFSKGEAKFEEGKLTGGTFVVDMGSITPTDENYGEDNPKEKLIGHLSSDDFFAVEEHPNASFEVMGGDMNTVKGTMTIRGISNTEAIENIEMVDMGDQIVFKGTMTIDRQKYNVAFEMPAEDKVLSDDLDFEFKVVLNKNKAA
jgi:polyisoprenoid-binding protein YceI